MPLRIHKLTLSLLLLATLGGWQSAASAGHSDFQRLLLAAQGGIPWQSLSPEEQQELNDYRDRWQQYDGEKQDKIRKGAQRYLSLPPERRDKIRQQRKHYRQLTPKEQQRLREEYRRNRR